ncbi:MAG: M48 family metallopeptidase [Chloroflexi bacterium]|nr:M48 family metallopeptidase [Chloroflexota bacterium]
MPIDPDRQKQASEYARIGHRLWALDLVVSALAILIVIALGLNVWLKDVILAVSANVWLATFLYFAAALAAYGALTSPLSYYSGYVLQHRYGLSTQTQRAWLVDLAKGGALGLVLGGVVLEAIYALLRVAPETWWLWACAFMVVFSVVLANLAPVLIFPIFFKFTPLQDDELVKRLTALAARAHTRVRGVYTMLLSEKTTAANAALMGLGNTRRIVLGDTLYDKYTPDEIEAVLAHELGHQVHHDIGWSLVAQTAFTLVGFFAANLFLKWSVGTLHYDGIADLAAFPLLGLALGAYGLITLPLENAFARWREALADDYALESTGNPAAFIGAMEKLADQNLAELEPEPWVEWLLYDHPPIGRRLRRGAEFAAAKAQARSL